MAAQQPRPLVAGNWKMNGTKQSLDEMRLLARMLDGLDLRCEVMICPPATLIAPLVEAAASTRILVGGQDCHMESHGAHTGDISAEMLKDAGCSAVIVGHSERRSAYGESDALVSAKATAAHRAGLVPIICIGETLEERRAGRALEIVTAQLEGSLPYSATPANTVIAYEPVWAIGTGLTPSPEEVAEVHGHIRSKLRQRLADADGGGLRILYGGSVKPENAAELLSVENVDGALVGGASLRAAEFFGIVTAYS